MLVAVVCFVVSSCQSPSHGTPGTKAEKEIVGKLYEKNGIKFSYPEYWKIFEETSSDKERTVVIADAPYCFIRIRILSGDRSIDLEKEVVNTAEKMQSKLPAGIGFKDNFETINRTFQGQQFEGIRLKGSFSTADAVIPDTTDFFLIEKAKSKAVIVINADDADWKVADKEFQFVLNSLSFD